MGYAGLLLEFMVTVFFFELCWRTEATIKVPAVGLSRPEPPVYPATVKGKPFQAVKHHVTNATLSKFSYRRFVLLIHYF